MSEINKLKILSAKIRLDILEMLEHIGYGHLGGSLSLVETMSALYGSILKFDPKNPKWEDRDFVVLSKGHCGPVWYSALAESGFFEKELLFTLNEGGTLLPSHPDRLKTPGVDMTTGSLGQGVSVAAGMAYALKLDRKENYVYVIVGDGELNEGQCWEAFQFIANYKLNNCIVIIDDNKRQLDGYTKDVINQFNIEEKMKSFGFAVKTVSGSSEEDICSGINELKEVKGSAACLVLDTIKGQGVPYFENMKSNHSVKFNNSEILEENHKAIEELKKIIEGR